MWSVAPELIAHLEDKETRHIFSLPDSIVVVIGVNKDFNDS